MNTNENNQNINTEGEQNNQPNWTIPNDNSQTMSWDTITEDTDNNDVNDFYTQGYSDDKPEKKKENNKNVKVIAITIAILLASTACGFAGSILGNQLVNKNTDSNGNAVITKSIVNTSNTAGSTATTADVVTAVADSVVEISTETVQTNNFLQQYVSEGAGSGVIIDSNGYILTNNHVIQGASKIQVRTRNGNTYEAKLVGTDAESDLAVIKIEETGLKSAVFSDSSKLVVGETAIAVGNPLGELGGTVTQGIISALDREITIEGQTMNLLQIDAAINPGNSGGGLFNSSGELIGIVNAKTSASGIEGLGFAIPSNTAQKIAADLIENGYVSGKVKLGVTMIEINDKVTAAQYNVSDYGVYIAQVNANSDAYYGGLKSGDRVVSINGEEIETSSQIKDIIENSSVGDKLSFVVKRGTKEVNLEITLTEYNSSASAFENTQNN